MPTETAETARTLRMRALRVEELMRNVGRNGCPEEGLDSTLSDLELAVSEMWDFVKILAGVEGQQ